MARIAESSYSRKCLPTDDEVCGILCAIQIDLIRLYMNKQTKDDMGKTLSADITPLPNNVNFAKALKCVVLALGV